MKLLDPRWKDYFPHTSGLWNDKPEVLIKTPWPHLMKWTEVVGQFRTGTFHITSRLDAYAVFEQRFFFSFPALCGAIPKGGWAGWGIIDAVCLKEACRGCLYAYIRMCERVARSHLGQNWEHPDQEETPASGYDLGTSENEA